MKVFIADTKPKGYISSTDYHWCDDNDLLMFGQFQLDKPHNETPTYITNTFGNDNNKILLFNNLPKTPKISEKHFILNTQKNDKFISFNYISDILKDNDKNILIKNILNIEISFQRNNKLESIFINGDNYISTIFDNNLLITNIDENTNINVNINYYRSPIFEKHYRNNLGYWVDQKYIKTLFDIRINNRQY